MDQKNSRRSFFKLAFAAVMAAPLASATQVFAAAKTESEKIKKKMINDRTAKRLKYVEDAKEAKKLKAKGDKSYKKYDDGQMCSNCKFYKVAKEDKNFGKCTMAANRYVYKEGWCKSYRAK